MSGTFRRHPDVLWVASPADIPKLAFGQVKEEGGRQWMPLALEVHHALMDGWSRAHLIAEVTFNGPVGHVQETISVESPVTFP